MKLGLIQVKQNRGEELEARQEGMLAQARCCYEDGADLVFFPEEHQYVMEDGVLTGGYGQYMKAHTPAFWQVTGFGWPDRFIEQGAPADLYQKYGMDAAGVAERIREDNRKED